MLIATEEAVVFFELHAKLLAFASARIPDVAGEASGEDRPRSDLEAAVRRRDALLENPLLIDEYVAQNPDHFDADQLRIIRSWKHFVRGDFIIERDLKSYTVFLSAGDPPTAYGVLGLTDEITDIVPRSLPAYVRGVLLPWKDRIVCDGLLHLVPVHFGGGIKRRFRDAYRVATAKGIVTCLDPEQAPAPQTAKRTVREPRTFPIARLLKRELPTTVSGFEEKFGEPKLDMRGEAAVEHSLWNVAGSPVLEIDRVLVYANIIRGQVLYVYGLENRVTHIGVVDRTEWYRDDLRAAPGHRLIR